MSLRFVVVKDSMSMGTFISIFRKWRLGHTEILTELPFAASPSSSVRRKLLSELRPEARGAMITNLSVRWDLIS